jgi:hypothetical protein
MLEDVNFFSRLGKDIHINPLLKDYLSFGRQLYASHPADKGKVTPENLPGRRKSKKLKQEDVNPSTVNLANLVFNDRSEESYVFEQSGICRWARL